MKIIDVIKYDGDNKTFVWKYPGEDFNTMSQLIVHESQIAVLFKGGRAQDEYMPGEYRLHTKNIPILNKLINLPSNGVSPFHCDVYFVNTTEQMNIKWGFGNVTYIDVNENNYPFSIGAHGTLSLRVKNAGNLLNKLVGTEALLTNDKFIEYFQSAITMHIKDLLPKFLTDRKVSIFQVENYLPEVSNELLARLRMEMSDYGIEPIKLWTDEICKPVQDPLYQQRIRILGEQATIMQQGQLELQRADFDRRAVEIRGAAEINLEKYKQNELGYTYQQKRGYDIMDDLAKNEGAGSDIRNAFMGMATGIGTAGVMGRAMENVADDVFGSDMFSNSYNKVSNVDEPNIPGMVNLQNEESNEEIFKTDSLSENQKEDEDMSAFKRKIKALKLLYEEEMISKEEYQKRINELISGE